MQTVEDGEAKAKIIDYGQSDAGSMFRNSRTSVCGRASYRTYVNGQVEFDGFLFDSFSIGVCVYGLMFKDYPWLSTRPGCCKCFSYVNVHGFRKFCANRNVRGTNQKIADSMSEPLVHLLEGRLNIDPNRWLTLDEKQVTNRRSVRDEPWCKHKRLGPGEGAIVADEVNVHPIPRHHGYPVRCSVYGRRQMYKPTYR